MDYLLLAIAIILMIVGIAGCLLPVLPDRAELPWTGSAAFFTVCRHQQEPVYHTGDCSRGGHRHRLYRSHLGTRRFGGSKYGMRGAAVGLIIGLFLGPFGIIIGPFIGAVVESSFLRMT